MVQPQAHVDSALQWDMTGGEVLGAGGYGSLGASSQGSLRIPQELASNEVVHRLLGDNHQLREALRRSNAALRERCEEMEGWQRKTREEREFLGSRFREARALVERLARENKALTGQLNHTGAGVPRLSLSAEQNRTDAQRDAPQNPPEVAELRVEKEGQKGVEREADRQTPPQSVADSSVCSSCSTVYPSLADSLSSPEREDGGEGEGGASSQVIGGGNEFLQLLKSHKEKLEEGMRELRRRNEELEKEVEEGVRERDSLRSTNVQLQAKLTEIQGCSVVEETIQRSESHAVSAESSSLVRLKEQLQATQCRYNELQEKLDCLQKTTVQRDRTEALLKQKDKECAQLAKDNEALKAQVTSLLGELNERQSCLDKSETDRERLNETLAVRTEALHSMEREVDQLKKQHGVTVDKLRLQTQSLEAALRTERLVLTEEKRKLVQLQHAYTQLFKDYDTLLKKVTPNGGEVEDLSKRLVDAETALALKQGLIDKLKEEVERLKASLETLPVLAAQAEIYKADFLAEREAREKLHQHKEELQERLNQALADIERLNHELDTRQRIQDMRQRHVEDFPGAQSQTGFPGATVPFNPAQLPSFRMTEEVPDYRCPKCQTQAPDMDTLQIHVMDCIQ
ncbi:NF-kappa-B essential modulator isoform X1 [Megalops cyprinoides]|uniref:NF-kappa-B essential modulator isoform X1 n=1 Tax=Megalops cyprinoides TaxID=118141 RepID=UPI0018640F19|nr:NF-kappa-B essential modulator isoform X1 [Megalops cyprinoides]